jgi:hypothetical protein
MSTVRLYGADVVTQNAPPTLPRTPICPSGHSGQPTDSMRTKSRRKESSSSTAPQRRSLPDRRVLRRHATPPSSEGHGHEDTERNDRERETSLAQGADSESTLGVREPPKARRGGDDHTVAWGIGVFGVVGLAIVARAIAPSIRRRRWRKNVRAQAGETAALAQQVPTRLAAERLLLGARCACGGAFGLAPDGAWTGLVYDGREITAGRATCSSCGERRVRYFAGASSK